MTAHSLAGTAHPRGVGKRTQDVHQHSRLSEGYWRDWCLSLLTPGLTEPTQFEGLEVACKLEGMRTVFSSTSTRGPVVLQTEARAAWSNQEKMPDLVALPGGREKSRA